MTRLQVHWRDSGTIHRDEGWSKKDAILQSCKIGQVITVGLLFHETEDTLYLALSYDPDNQSYYGVQAIWKENIVKRVVLRER